MACAMGSALSRQVTVRPLLDRVMSPASESTFKCLRIAGSDIVNGSASAPTGMPSSAFGSRRASSARRVGSASAAKVRSSASSEYLTIRLSIGSLLRAVNGQGWLHSSSMS